jgi:hypothetical protein
MSVTRAELTESLSLHDPEALRAILDAAGVGDGGRTEARELAARLTDAIWWSYTTPLGYVAGTGSLEQIVAHVARTLRVYVPGDLDGWDALRELTRVLLEDLNRRGVRVDDLPPGAQARLGRRWGGAAVLGVGSAGSAGAWWASGKVAGLLATPIARLLPYVPTVGPWVGTVKAGAATIHLVSGPLAIALAVLSVNSALGANYRKLVPLLLGVGALGPSPVAEAEEVPTVGPTVAEA